VLQKAPPYLAMSYIRAKERGDVPEVPDWNPQTSGPLPSGVAPQVAPQQALPQAGPIDNSFTQMFPRPQGAVPQMIAGAAQGVGNYYDRMKNSFFSSGDSTDIDARLQETRQRGPWDGDVSGARQVNNPFVHAIEGLGFAEEGSGSKYENQTYGGTVKPHNDPEYVWFLKQKATDPRNPNAMTPQEFDRKAMELGWARPTMPEKLRKPALMPKGYVGTTFNPSAVDPRRTDVEYNTVLNSSTRKPTGRPKGY
jgi:hypothetical protein